MGQSPDGANYTSNPNNAILVQGNADMVDGWVFPRVYTKQITKQAHVGDLIFSVRAPVGEVGKTQYDVVIGRGVAAISGNEFIFQTLKRMNAFGYWTRLSSGSTFESINSDTLKAAEIAVPGETEQKSIGEILLKLDNLITLHQRKRNSIFLLNAPKKVGLFLADSWEQRKFEDIYVSAAEGGTPDTNHAEYYGGNIPFVKIEDTENKYIEDARSHISEKGLINSSAWLVPPNSIIFTNGATVGNVAINKRIVATKQGILGLILKKSFEVEFIYYLLSSQKFQQEVISRQAKGTFATIILRNLNEIVVSVPNLCEQEVVSELLSKLDNLITLHQRKCQTKKEVNLREKQIGKLTDWTNAWEQRKFKETVLIERGGSPRPIDDYITDQENGLNWIKIGDAPEMGNYITQTAEKIRPEGLSKTREVYPGDLILSNSMSFGKPYIMGIYGCIHDGWLLIRNEKGVFDLTFLCHLLGTQQMLVQYRSFAAGSTVNNLNKELVGGTVVKYPSMQDQQTIGAFFNKLDNLITLHQRRLIKIQGDKNGKKRSFRRTIQRLF